jgi:K+-transporting ATPase ATPase B chain
VSDSNHDRRSAVGDWHRGHGPRDALQRAGQSGRAVEAAGDVDVLLLDKTGTITFGNRLAAEILPVGGATSWTRSFAPGSPVWATIPLKAAASRRWRNSWARPSLNMVDLDSNPTKLIEVVAIGKQLLITRGAITTFSVANDVARYFAIIPAAFVATYPHALNVMQLATPESAILSAVIFNALIIIALVPLALRCVGYLPDTGR